MKSAEKIDVVRVYSIDEQQRALTVDQAENCSLVNVNQENCSLVDIDLGPILRKKWFLPKNLCNGSF